MRITFHPHSAALGAATLVVVLGSSAAVGVNPTAHALPGRAPGQPVATMKAPLPGSSVVREQIGTSVQHRPIYAYELGSSSATIKAVIQGSMHGEEFAGVRMARSLVRRGAVQGIDLWVVPTINPDGLAVHVRQNAHGVDLNKNWAFQWKFATGRYASGPRPFSEPETRAMRDFLNRIDPLFLVSFHQPLHAVDSDHVKNTRLMHRLSSNLTLPIRALDCGGVCHGIMTGWFNKFHAGAAITVEFGPTPPRQYLINHAAIGTVRSVLGHY